MLYKCVGSSSMVVKNKTGGETLVPYKNGDVVESEADLSKLFPGIWEVAPEGSTVTKKDELK